MSTRGAIGFRINGQDKMTYNHSDSYPSWLGVQFVEQVRKLVKRADLNEKVEAINVVDGDTPPTADEKAKLVWYANLSVSDQTADDWYCLLRNAQGKLDEYVKCGYMLAGNDFITDSLFCEYAYILNLDRGVVEFYKGFNKNPKAPGRYSGNRADYGNGRLSDYYGCALVGVYPMTDIPDDWQEQLFPVEED